MFETRTQSGRAAELTCMVFDRTRDGGTITREELRDLVKESAVDPFEAGYALAFMGLTVELHDGVVRLRQGIRNAAHPQRGCFHYPLDEAGVLSHPSAADHAREAAAAQGRSPVEGDHPLSRTMITFDHL